MPCPAVLSQGKMRGFGRYKVRRPHLYLLGHDIPDIPRHPPGIRRHTRYVVQHALVIPGYVRIFGGVGYAANIQWGSRSFPRDHEA